MKFKEIQQDATVFPGEYLLHTPTQQIVMCGAFRRSEDRIKAMSDGKLMEDKIENFQKIYLSEKEQKKKKVRRSCGGCKS
jgi:hypothetical protein